jgi:hypothetical protein
MKGPGVRVRCKCHKNHRFSTATTTSTAIFGTPPLLHVPLIVLLTQYSELRTWHWHAAATAAAVFSPPPPLDGHERDSDSEEFAEFSESK